eukprot:TRINITY_DN9537_c0_g4_i8.p1 TRINITY_DN9537_c0_g4~~TRINITY_DN9537_c0_g4_i8.p1  ORF type:complete len:764 (-),score=144.29 TRINITY_DN9537_c0_g4_i8:593-2884(-)
MRSKRDNVFHRTLEAFQTYITSLISNVLKGTFGSWLLPYSDLLMENIETVASFVQYQLIVFIYKFALTFHCLWFALCKSNHLGQRVSFIFLVIVTIFRLKWSLPRNGLKEAKSIGIPDSALVFILNALVNQNDSEWFVFINLFLITVLAFYPTITKMKFLLIAGLAAVNTYVYGMREGCSWSSALLVVSIYGFIVCMGNAYIEITADFSKKLANLQKETEIKLLNNSMFVASISHDLKNPLNSILGCLDLLKNSDYLSTQEKHFLVTASYSGKIMTYLIANILDTAKMAKGKFDIDRAPMDIAEVLSKVASIESELAKAKHLCLYEKVLTPLPKFVYGDEMRFSQILINLMGNAIKFTSKGYTAFILTWTNSIEEAKTRDSLETNLIPPEEYFLMSEVENLSPKELEEAYNITTDEFEDPLSEKMKKYLSTGRNNTQTGTLEMNATSFSSSSPMCAGRINRFLRRSRNRSLLRESWQISERDKESQDDPLQDDSGLLIVDVIDTGIGVTAEEQTRVFQPFKQANSSVKAKYGGTGLGLWITKQLVYLMSGFIELRSIPGKGSRFTITLPFKVVNSKPMESTLDLNERLGTSGELGGGWRDLRTSRRLILTGRNTILNKMNLLIIEDDKVRNDSLLSQTFNQLKNTDCSLSYCSYSDAINVLRANSFEAVLVISSNKQTVLVNLVKNLMREIRENNSSQISLCVATGNLARECLDQADLTELRQLRKVELFTFPLNEGYLVNQFNKLRSHIMYSSLLVVDVGKL